MGLGLWGTDCHQQQPDVASSHAAAAPPVTMSEPVHPAACPLIDGLPAEIRMQIYEYVLFENGDFFSLDDEEGNSVPTLFPKLRAPPKPRRRRRQHQRSQLLLGADGETTPSEARSGGNIMSLLLTSKLIYDEASALLYSTSFFRLRGIRSTIQFINTVSPAHLALVHSVKLVWDDQGWTSAPEYDTPTLRSAWPSLCGALAADFAGLRNLYVALGMPSGSGPGGRVEALYLGELARVRHVPNFKVCIPVGFLTKFYGLDAGDGGAHEEDVREAPFELCRHTAGEVCDVRREVIAAEWCGGSRPSTPGLSVKMPNAPGLEPWADGEWEEADGKGA